MIIYFALISSLYQINSEDCSNGICDITSKLKASIEHCDANPPIPHQPRVGCTFEIPSGRFVLSETIRLYRQHRIRGQGGRFWGANTQINTLGGYSAFVIESHPEAKKAGRGWGGGGSIIESLAIYGSPGTSTVSVSFGVDIKDARVKLSELYIRGFVQGLHVNADVAYDGKNANGFIFEDIRIDNSEHAGVFIDGADANAGLLSAVDSSANCQHAKRWEAVFGACANVIDSSFLGNTHVASHTAFCKDRDTGLQCNAYISDGYTQRSVYIGTYSEWDQKPGLLSQNSNAIGGLAGAGWSGVGAYFFGRRINSLIIENAKDKSNTTQLWLGDAASPGTVMEFRSNALIQGWPLGLYASPDGWWIFRLANSNRHLSLKFWAKDDSTRPLGSVIVRGQMSE